MNVWVVVEDAHKAVGLSLPLSVIPVLVAACAGDPQSFESLLEAADFYAHGLAGVVTDSLLMQDRQVVGGGSVPGTVRIAEEFPRRAVGQLLGRTGDDGLLYIDLNERVLVVHGRATEHAHRRGEVEVMSRGTPTGRKVTYQLSPSWHITAHREV